MVDRNKDKFLIKKEKQLLFPKKEKDLKIPVQVYGVTVKGRKNTNKSLLEGHLLRFETISTLQELLESTDNLMKHLKDLDIFTSANIEFDIKKKNWFFNDRECDIKVSLEEKNPNLRLKSFLDPFSFGGSLSKCNYNGNGGRIDLFGNIGNPVSSTYLSFSKPYLDTKSLTLKGKHLGFYKKTIPYGISQKIKTKGLKIEYSYPYIQHYYYSSYLPTSKKGTHSLTYCYEKRTTEPMNDTKFKPNMTQSDSKNLYEEGNEEETVKEQEIEEEDVYAKKSSIMYRYRIDTRDHPTIPSKGLLFDLSNELSGIFHNNKFLKSKLKFDFNLPLFLGLSYSLKADAGISSAFSTNENQSLSIYDKFYPTREKELNTLTDYFLIKNAINNNNQENENRQNQIKLKASDFYASVCNAITLSFGLKKFSKLKMGCRLFARSNLFGNRKENFINLKDNLINSFNNRKSEFGIGLSSSWGFKRLDFNYTLPIEKIDNNSFKNGKFSFEMDFN
ncbi:sorting and assembly machinery component 50 [Anaeramoeba flamelloides]|uniref:Sorting and assembly machinery component 50 n=1 Tax=Anaeramoeba flamelloides TaxID=1746091 RepID=A0ABQ8X2A2_9EUKA|nr:sorting and assembly machinery component 50 [Anaeramoeba flamelloides]